ncbi:MAG: hypothetical protein AAF607_16775 [Pseudomonadota bacterium]
MFDTMIPSQSAAASPAISAQFIEQRAIRRSRRTQRFIRRKLSRA